MARASGSISRTFVWILLALLIAGLAGFGAVGLSGTVRTVGAVGDKNITVDAYVRALRNEIRATEAQRGAPLTFQQAQSMGIDTQALGRLITARSLDQRCDLEAALKTMLDHPGPYLLEVHVGREDNVFPMIPAGASVSEVRLC